MTPQERQLLSDLFDRLATLEKAPRDAEAIRLINDGLVRAPNAIYALVQSVLVQDEALKRADGRISELEAQLGGEGPQGGAPQGGFLDNMRDAMFGRREPQGSVPSVRSGGASPWGPAHQRQAGNAWSGNPSGSAWNNPQGQPMGGAQTPGAPGGSFLGTAASAAAGVVGGALLLGGIRSMFGGHQSQAFGSYDQSGSGGSSGFGGGDSELSRQAGINDIGGSRNAAHGDGDSSQRAGLFDTAQQDDNDNDDNDSFDSDFASSGDFGGGDSDST